jgi:hypothetical protein
VEAPIKIAQKLFIVEDTRGGERVEVLADVFLWFFYKYIMHQCIFYYGCTGALKNGALW